MKLTDGSKAPSIQLPALDGSTFQTDDLKGLPYLLSFLRFATCPFCNLRVRELVQRFDEFGDDFTVVAIFDSTLENLQRHAGRHEAPFPILADKSNRYYREYQVEHSILGMIKGMVFRMPTMLKGMWEGPFPLPPRGSVTTMPADFLIDEGGTIRTAYYAKDEGDHLPIDEIIAFSRPSHPAGPPPRDAETSIG